VVVLVEEEKEGHNKLSGRSSSQMASFYRTRRKREGSGREDRTRRKGGGSGRENRREGGGGGAGEERGVGGKRRTMSSRTRHQ